MYAGGRGILRAVIVGARVAQKRKYIWNAGMKIGCFGAFDFDNYGDLLLGRINRAMLGGAGGDVLLFSPDYASKLKAPGGAAISATEVAEHNLDAVVVGGGDVMTLAPTDEIAENTGALFSPRQWNRLLPALMAKVNRLPLVKSLSPAGIRKETGSFSDYREVAAQRGEDQNQPEKMVSIVVPAYNCWDMTKACVDSIRRHTRYPYELILIDDASDADTAQKMAALADERTVVIRNESRCSFSINNNKAVAVARGDFICLLNNDTLVTEGWLKPMVEELERYEDVAVIGNKHLFPDSGKLHHCGMAYDEKSYPWHIHPHTDPNAPAVNYNRDVPCVTFACVLIRREHYRELGGLDEEYRNGFEDCDFCMRTLEKGRRIRYVPASVIYHYGQSSEGRTDYDNVNWKLFEKRWKGKTENSFKQLTKSDREWNRKVLKARTTASDREKGIHFAIDFSHGGAFTWAAAELIEALVNLGEDVSVTYARRMPGLDDGKRRLLRRLMRKRAYGRFHIKWSHYWPQHLKAPMAGKVNAELFCTNYRYRKEGRRLDLWMRHVQVSNHKWLPISGFNRDALLDVGIETGNCPVMPLGYAPEADKIECGSECKLSAQDGRLHILMITNSADLERYGTDIAVRAFGRAFGPDDEVVLHIKDYGAYTGSAELKEWIKQQPRFPEVVWHSEFLTKPKLMELYASMDVQVAPFRGEGFGMKIIDAMALGVPVMMPLFGGPAEYAVEGGYIPLAFNEVPVGECFDSRNSYIGEGAYWCEVVEEDLVKQLGMLPERRSELSEVGERARRHVRDNFTWRQAAERLMQNLDGWWTEREAKVAVRRQPSVCELTVIIPTLNREDILAQALEAYGRQSLAASRYEIIIVNDHGDLAKVRQTVADHGEGLNIKVLNNLGRRGPAAARNLAIEHARGEIVLITGDDIIPDSNFLDAHLELHRRNGGEHIACVGNTKWHPEIEVTPFMEHLSGEGGQQFNYRDSHHGREVPFDRFYTSNVSVKRMFLIEEEDLFLTSFCFAAYEDVELSYRLHLAGMRLLYNEKAVGYHHHAMTPQSFVRRQQLVGRMLTHMALVQPSYVPLEHTVFLESLEFARNDEQTFAFVKELGQGGDAGAFLVGDVTKVMEQILAGLPVLNASGRVGVKAEDAFKHSQWLAGGCGPLWDAVNGLVLREGMAEEWAANDDDTQWAKQWVRMVTLREVIKDTQATAFYDVMHPRNRIQSVLGSPFLFDLVNKLIATPGVGPLVSSFMRSRLADRLRMMLRR